VNNTSFTISNTYLNEATVALAIALEPGRGVSRSHESATPSKIAANMLVVSQSCNHQIIVDTDHVLRKTKHAAELCAHLVNDIYGELPSVRVSQPMDSDPALKFGRVLTAN
jgi:hypothetical protein